MNAGAHTSMRQGNEFDAIRNLLDIWGDIAAGIGDDAALLPAPGVQLVISTDACIEDVHFRRGWIGARATGARACQAALSDLAAMGAKANSILVSFVIPDAWRDQLADVAHGIGDAARGAGALIIGGNLSSGAQFGITTTVVGHCAQPVTRSGARPGDVLLVTGLLGGPSSAIGAMERGTNPEPWAMARFVRPKARLEEGQWLAASGVSAMIDISDGLLADATHLAVASGVAIIVDPNRVPVGPVDIEVALNGGEEYELLATVPAEKADRLIGEFRERFDTGITAIGEVEATSGQGAASIRDVGGRKVNIVVEISPGHDHFSQ